MLITTSLPGGARRPSTVAERRGISARYPDALIRWIEDGSTEGVIERVWETRLHVVLADTRTDPLIPAAHDPVRDDIATAQGVADHFAVAVARTIGLAPAPLGVEPMARQGTA